MPKQNLFFILAAFLIAAGGCKKKNNAPPEIIVSGTQHAGYLVGFQYTGGTSTYLWSFGDGSQSTDPRPNHTYNYASTYIVTLVINNDTLKKMTKTVQIDPAFDFTWTGVPAAGYTLVFSSTAPAGSTLLWNFDDGTTSTEVMPAHTYASNGTYYVTLMIDNDADHIVKKKVVLFGTAAYLADIPGTRTFHHTYTDAYPWAPYHTTYTRADAALTIRAPVPGTLAIGTDTLFYAGNTNGDSVLLFSAYDNYGGRRFYFYYNHFTGSMDYYKYVHISAGAGDAYDRFFLP